MRIQPITFSDLEMRVETKKGYEGKQNISCGSMFIIGVIEKLCNATSSTCYIIRVVN